MNKDILKGLFGEQEGVLSESAQQQITEAFNAKLDELVEERVGIALETQDKEHTEMLQQVVEKYENKLKSERKAVEEKLDSEHARMTKEAFDLVDEDRAKKVLLIKEKYEKLLNEEVEKQTEAMVIAVSKYLDTFLEQHIPTEVVAESAKHDHSTELLNKISKLVTLDRVVTEDIKKSMEKSDKIIREQAKELELLKTKEYLREKTKNLPVLEQKFIVESFKGKSFDYAKRNFDYVRQLFIKSHNSTPIIEKSSAVNVDRQPQVITESRRVSGEEAKVPTALAVWAEKSKTNKLFGQ